LAAEAQRIFPAGAVSYEWIPRAQNQHADRLANEAMDAGKNGGQWQPSASRAELDAPAPAPAAPAPDTGSGQPPLREEYGAAESAPPAPGGSAGWGPADLGTPTTFQLLRHGETVLTPEKRFSGSGGSDPELSAVGLRQAEAVASALAERGEVQAVVSSPLRRCQQTASAVAERLGLRVRTDDGLRETD